MLGVASWLTVLPAVAQDTNLPPVAQPMTNSGTPPVALPVVPVTNSPTDTNQPPVASPTTNAGVAPVAVPLFSGSTNATTPAPPPLTLDITTPAASHFDSAMVFFNGGQYVDAVTAFSAFISDFPTDRHREEALYRLAESYRALGHTDDALAAYTYQVQNYPDGPLRINGELRRGAILFDEGKITDAMVPLQFVADKGDGDLQQIAKYLLGRGLIATQKEADGRALLQSLINQQPPGKYSSNAAQALAELDESQKKYPEALSYWQMALTLAADPTVQATLAARGGWAAIAANQPAVAEKLFQATRQLDPNGDARKVANTGLLRLLFEQKRYAEWVAIYQVDQDKILDSSREENLYDAGHAQFKLKHWPEAIAGFDDYLKEFGSKDAAVTAAYERFLAVTQVDHDKLLSEADAYLKAWPKSPYRARVQLLQAQELSAQKKFTDALPLWQSLAREPGGDSWPRLQILRELARTYDTLNDFPNAATAYQAYLDELAAHPGDNQQARLSVEARLAVCLQKSNQLLAATDAWKAVQSLAPNGSPEQKMALESLGLIYARGGPAQEQAMVTTFRQLLDRFPQSDLRALAAFSVGDSMFNHRDYAGAETYLLDARNWDATTWMQPATQRLVLAAYGLKDYDKTVAYLKEYDTLPVPTDPQAVLSARLPAALFYWLAETARKAGKWDEAETFYTRVTQHPDPGELLAGAWWELGEVQSERKEWPAAVASYGKYRVLKPDTQNATLVLLALGRAQLGAQNFDQAKDLGNQALLQEPEGPNSAAARMLLGEIAMATKDYPDAERMFGTLAVLFDDPKLTPQAMSRAADAFDQAGDAKSAADWRQKLKDKYPQYQPVSYL